MARPFRRDWLDEEEEDLYPPPEPRPFIPPLPEESILEVPPEMPMDAPPRYQSELMLPPPRIDAGPPVSPAEAMARPRMATPGPQQQRAAEMRAAEIERLQQPTPMWRKILGGALMASRRLAPVGEAIAGNDERRRMQAMQLAGMAADDERLQRWNKAQEELRREQIATQQAHRQALRQPAGQDDSAIVRAMKEGFIPLGPGQQPPDGRALVKIGNVGGYQLLPEELALRSRSMSHVGIGPQGVLDPSTGKVIYGDPTQVREIATAKRPTPEETKATAQAGAEGRAAGTPPRRPGSGSPTQKVAVDRETGKLQREFGDDVEAAKTAARERIKDDAILKGVLENLSRSGPRGTQTGGGFFPAGFDPFKSPSGSGTPKVPHGGKQYQYTEQQVRQRARAAKKDEEFAVREARKAKLIP